MSDETEANNKNAEEIANDEVESSPRGTMVILVVYLVIIIGIWGTVYFTLLDRG